MYRFYFILLFLPVACSIPSAPEVHPLPAPSGSGSAYPRLYAQGERLYLSWLDISQDSLAGLMYSSWDGKAWQASERIASGTDWFINWADFPGLIAHEDGSLAAWFLQKSGSDPYAYDVKLTFSGGNGEWSTPAAPYTDSPPSEHGFVSLYPDGKHTGLIWLDGSLYANEGPGPSRLFQAEVEAGGNVLATHQLDARICDCCQTDVAKTASGLVAVYRDRSEEDVRDIGRVVFQKGAWSEPAPVATDNWKITGCPVNGPAVSAAGDNVVTAWFTKPSDSAYVKVAFSEDGGLSFGEPIRVDNGRPEGRVDVVLRPGGTAWVSWVAMNKKGKGELHLRAVQPDGKLSPLIKVADFAEGKGSGFPSMACIGTNLYIAWTYGNGSSTDEIRISHINLAP
ncbi:MAG: exo-alpha-sialidase [Bacteroidetes bacterium]|nr:MAG: exo-alpha-sialidase [Bacteroidota bacterium]